jgi:CRISPR/Cas system-associated endoribonuclease Cas2
MMKKLWAMAMLCLWFAGGAQAQQQETKTPVQQPDKLATLMSEREQLILEYQFYNQQNSNFWGKKSKNDLLAIIETLKKIINKDSELIAAVKEASIRKVAESTVEIKREGKITVEDQRNISARMADLQGQINTLQSAVKKRERTIKDLEAQVQETEELRYGKDKVISVLAVAAFVLLLYSIFLQVRLSSTKAKVRKKKAVK